MYLVARMRSLALTMCGYCFVSPVLLLRQMKTVLKHDHSHHLRNKSGTGWCVSGTNDGLFTAGWDYIKPGTPAKDPVYGAPYLGCGCYFHVYYHSDGTTSWHYGERYLLHSSSLDRADNHLAITCSSGEYEDYHALNSYDLYARGCSRFTPSTVCPVSGTHLPDSRAGRPYDTLITPGVPATPETYPTTGARYEVLRVGLTLCLLMPDQLMTPIIPGYRSYYQDGQLQ